MRMWRFVTSPRLMFAAIAAAVLVAVLGGIGVANATAQSVAEASPKTISPLFARDQTSGDVLPTFLTSGNQSLEGVVPDSTRMIGSSQGVDYWIATNSTQQVCLISLLPGTGEFAAMTCRDGASILDSGLPLQTADSDVTLRAYFLPEGYTASASGLSHVGSQLLVGSANAAAPTIQAVKASTDTNVGPSQLTIPALSALSPNDVN
jgi:hypothetical protein